MVGDAVQGGFKKTSMGRGRVCNECIGDTCTREEDVDGGRTYVYRLYTCRRKGSKEATQPEGSTALSSSCRCRGCGSSPSIRTAQFRNRAHSTSRTDPGNGGGRQGAMESLSAGRQREGQHDFAADPFCPRPTL